MLQHLLETGLLLSNVFELVVQLDFLETVQLKVNLQFLIRTHAGKRAVEVERGGVGQGLHFDLRNPLREVHVLIPRHHLLDLIGLCDYVHELPRQSHKAFQREIRLHFLDVTHVPVHVLHVVVEVLVADEAEFVLLFRLRNSYLLSLLLID